MKHLSMIIFVVLINSATISHQLSDCLTCTDGNTAPYHITQPPTNDLVQIASPDAAMVMLMCSLNISIPAGMTITWLHNDTVILTNTNKDDQSTNTAWLKRGGPIPPSYTGHYQCMFNDNIGHILTRNITLLILHAPRIIQPMADYDRETFNESTSSIRLRCSLNITIPSSVTVTWTHNDNIVMSRRPKRITQAGNTTTLRIRNPQPSDAGEYQCIFNGLDLQRIILLESQSSSAISTPAMIATSMTVSTNTVAIITQSIAESVDHTTSSAISTDTVINAITTTATTTTTIITTSVSTTSDNIVTTSTNTNSILSSSPTLLIPQSKDSINPFSVEVIAVIVTLTLVVFIIITVVVMGIVVVYRKRKKSKQCIKQDVKSRSPDYDEATVQRSSTNTPQSIDGISHDRDDISNDAYSIPTDSITTDGIPNETYGIPNNAIPKDQTSEHLKYANIPKDIKLTKQGGKTQENLYSIPFSHIEVQPNPAYAHSTGTIRLSEAQYH